MKRIIISMLVIVAIISCSVEKKHFNSYPLKNDIKMINRYCGNFDSIYFVNKRLSLIYTNKTEFVIWGHPEIKRNAWCYIRYQKECIMPTDTEVWRMYLCVNGHTEKYRLSENHITKRFSDFVMWINEEPLNPNYEF